MEGYKLRRSYDEQLHPAPVSQVMSVVLPLFDSLQTYLSRHPEEADLCNDFLQFLVSAPTVFMRTHSEGHFTGSSWLVSADGERVLLTHHRKLERWLQLGGHADGDDDLARVALREAEEESGLDGLFVERDIFDLDRHLIPARGGEPSHWHYDVRFIVRTSSNECFELSDESLALVWKPVHAVASDPHVDESLRRMARKWLGINRSVAELD